MRTYERIALIAAILPKVYIDKEWVAQEYLMRCKAGAWKKESRMDALKCCNFECMIGADLHRQPTPTELTLEEFIKEGESSYGKAIVDLVED